MKQVKMDFSKELDKYFNSQENQKRKQNLKTICKVLFIAGGGIGCFVLGSKYTKLCIDLGLSKIFDNYPDVEKAMFESVKDYCIKNDIKCKL